MVEIIHYIDVLYLFAENNGDSANSFFKIWHLGSNY